MQLHPAASVRQSTLAIRMAFEHVASTCLIPQMLLPICVLHGANGAACTALAPSKMLRNAAQNSALLTDLTPTLRINHL